MTYKKSPSCTVCKKIKKNRALETEIWESKRFRNGDKNAKSLRSIAEQYHLDYQAMLRHVKNHQTATTEQLSTMELQRLAKRAELKTRVEESAMTLPTKQGPVMVWDNVIDTAMEQMKNGEMKLTANHLLKAAKDKSDYDIKKKNQDMAIMEMMWHFASGEATGSTEYDRRVIEGETAESYNAADITASNLERWENGSGDIHNGIAGNAVAPGPDKVFEGDDF